MIRRSFPLLGGPRPWKKFRKPDARPVIHASEKPPADAFIDFEALNLTHQLSARPKVVIPRLHWTEPPKTPPDLPFHVARTSLGKHLPVYTDYKGGRTKVITMLRRCRGDISTLRVEMEKVCGKPVSIRPGKLVVDGNFVMRLKVWLSGLGF